MLVEDVERLELASVGDGVELEVDGPHMVGVDRAEPLGVLGAGPAALPGPDRTTQTLLSPESLDALVVSRSSRVWWCHAQQPIAIRRPTVGAPRDPTELGAQPELLISARPCREPAR